MIISIREFINKLAYKPDLLLLIFAFFLPLLPQVSQIAIAIYLLLWIFNKQYLYINKIKSNWFAIGLIAYFMIFVLSGLYSSNLQLWGADLEAKLPFLALPFLLISRKQYDNKLLVAIFWTFLSGCLAFIVFLLYQFYFEDGTNLRNISMRKTFLNPIYFAMFISAILLIGSYSFFQKEKITVSLKNVINLVGLLFIHYILFALASRMAILAAVGLELLLVFIWQFIFKKQFIKGTLWIIAIVFINLLSLRYIELARQRMAGPPSKESRLLIWEASKNQFVKSPVIGYGSGDASAIMKEGYGKIGYDFGIKHNQNCHNQYFETMISTGLVGLIILMSWFVLAFKISWKESNYILCLFIGIIALNILTESMFERQQGTYFVAFFGCILSWKNYKVT